MSIKSEKNSKYYPKCSNNFAVDCTLKDSKEIIQKVTILLLTTPLFPKLLNLKSWKKKIENIQENLSKNLEFNSSHGNENGTEPFPCELEHSWSFFF